MSNTPKLERRMFAAQIRSDKAVDGKPSKMVGYAAVFDSPSEDLGGFTETIAPGAFTRALQENQDVRALINHDPNLVVGRTKSGTLRLSQDENGLKIECDMPDTTYARDLTTSLERRKAHLYRKELVSAVSKQLRAEGKAHEQVEPFVQGHILFSATVKQ